MLYLALKWRQEQFLLLETVRRLRLGTCAHHLKQCSLGHLYLGPQRKRGQKERTEGLVGEGERWGTLISGCDLADVCRHQLTAALVICTRLGQSKF